MGGRLSYSELIPILHPISSRSTTNLLLRIVIFPDTTPHSLGDPNADPNGGANDHEGNEKLDPNLLCLGQPAQRAASLASLHYKSPLLELLLARPYFAIPSGF